MADESVVVGWDFSTDGVKCLAFGLDGHVIADVRLPNDLWTEHGVTELNLMQLEGQVRGTTRAIAGELRVDGRVDDWVVGGVSATHHSAGRIDEYGNQVRRAIFWNDQTLAAFHAEGLNQLGGPVEVQRLLGAPWAIRYSLTHLVKDEKTLKPSAWRRTARILQHGPLAAGYLTGRFDVCSVSAAASTGIMDLQTNQWRREMLNCLTREDYREMAWAQLPSIIDGNELLGPLSESLALEAGLSLDHRPLFFPTLDDQAAGLVGGGAVDPGQVAIILGNSAVVNSSSDRLPDSGSLDVMKLNWGPYLWMRCYTNGAIFLNEVVGPNPEWDVWQEKARPMDPGCDGVRVLPFAKSEPSFGVTERRLEWLPEEPTDPVIRYRAALEAIAYLVVLGVREHEAAGQSIQSISVSGGIARSDLMCEILASLLNRPLKRLQSEEGPALGAAVTGLAALECYRRKQQGIGDPFTVANAVKVLVRYREDVQPNPAWVGPYQERLAEFERWARPT